jgi:hypothetical protein
MKLVANCWNALAGYVSPSPVEDKKDPIDIRHLRKPEGCSGRFTHHSGYSQRL